MREILFRGRSLITDDWVYGAYVRFRNVEGNVYDGIIEEYDGENLMSEIYSVNPKTVGQFTGIYDYNGKRIFEGDIIRGAYLNDDVVEYCHNGFFGVHKAKNGASICDVLTDNCTVVGNIYEQENEK